MSRSELIPPHSPTGEWPNGCEWHIGPAWPVSPLGLSVITSPCADAFKRPSFLLMNQEPHRHVLGTLPSTALDASTLDHGDTPRTRLLLPAPSLMSSPLGNTCFRPRNMADTVASGTVMSLQETVSPQLVPLPPALCPAPSRTRSDKASSHVGRCPTERLIKASVQQPTRHSPANDYTSLQMDPFPVQPLDETAALAGTLGETQSGGRS